MQNDVSRQWSFLTPFVLGEVLEAQARGLPPERIMFSIGGITETFSI